MLIGEGGVLSLTLAHEHGSRVLLCSVQPVPFAQTKWLHLSRRQAGVGVGVRAISPRRGLRQSNVPFAFEAPQSAQGNKRDEGYKSIRPRQTPIAFQDVPLASRKEYWPSRYYRKSRFR